MMFGDYFRSRASMAAQIKTQAATIADLTDDLTIANGQVKARDGEIDGLKLILRQVEGQLGTAHDCQNRLAAKVAKQAAELDKYRPVRGDGGKWTSKRAPALVSTIAGEQANA